jgi:hypothetical protein
MVQFGNLLSAAAPLLLALTSTVAGDAVVDLQKQGRVAVNAQVQQSKTCTKETLRIRKEW